MIPVNKIQGKINSILIMAKEEPSDFTHHIIKSGVGSDTQPNYLDIFEDCTEDLIIERLSKVQIIKKFELTEEQFKFLEERFQAEE